MNITLTQQELNNPTVIEARIECLMRQNAKLISVISALVRECDESEKIDVGHVHGAALDDARALLKELN